MTGAGLAVHASLLVDRFIVDRLPPPEHWPHGVA